MLSRAGSRRIISLKVRKCYARLIPTYLIFFSIRPINDRHSLTFTIRALSFSLLPSALLKKIMCTYSENTLAAKLLIRAVALRLACSARRRRSFRDCHPRIYYRFRLSAHSRLDLKVRTRTYIQNIYSS
jgi:hypothetical protein